MGDWMPGAREALRRFHETGCKVLIHTARLNPFNPWTSLPRDKATVAMIEQEIRRKLDDAGLTFVDIWRMPGKPGGSVYIDDRGERYNGHAKSWERLVEKVLMRLELATPELPEFDQELARG